MRLFNSFQEKNLTIEIDKKEQKEKNTLSNEMITYREMRDHMLEKIRNQETGEDIKISILPSGCFFCFY